MSIRSKVVSGLYWVTAGRLIGQVLNWAVTLVVIRVLSPEDYGLLAMATVFASFLMLMADAGLGSALVQTAEVDDAKLGRVFGAVILVNLVLFAIQFAAAPLVAVFFGEERLTAIVRVLGASFLIGIFGTIPSVLITRRLDFKVQQLIGFASTVVTGLTTLGLALSGYGVWSLVIGNLAGRVLDVVIVNIVAPAWNKPVFALHGVRDLVRFGLQMTGARVLWFIYSQGDMLIAGKLLGKELLGFYSVSMHLASLPAQRMSSILGAVGFAAFSRVQDDAQATASYVLKALRIVGFVAFPVLWGMSSVSLELVTVVLGEKWYLAILPLQIVAVVMVLRAINVVLGAAIDGVGRADISLVNMIVSNAIMLPSFVVGSLWGLTGLSLAWGCASPVAVVLNWLRILPVLNLSVREILRAVIPSAFCAGAMYAAVFAARWSLDLDMGLSRFLILVGVGVVSYALLSLAFNRKVVLELLELRKR